jgi:hypothetical protein
MPRAERGLITAGASAVSTSKAEEVQDRLDGDAVPGADLDDADAGLLPFAGVRHLV